MGGVYGYYEDNEDGRMVRDENGGGVYDMNKYDYLSGGNIVQEVENNIKGKNGNRVKGEVYGSVKLVKEFCGRVRGKLFSYNEKSKEFDKGKCGDGGGKGGGMGVGKSGLFEYRFGEELYWGDDFEGEDVEVLLGDE